MDVCQKDTKIRQNRKEEEEKEKQRCENEQTVEIGKFSLELQESNMYFLFT